ncbi:MAG: hypothetical protein IKI11_03240 [Neisseriaceae bacterium]|nr:hypothetical protein [Neisseriaceae bacterium]
MSIVSKKIITATVIGALSLSGLTACVISDDPYVNTTATAATTAGVVSLLLYSLHDGYYYDQDYRRMPQHYRPPHNVQIIRVNNIHEYRKAHPRPAVRHTPQPHTQRQPAYQHERDAKRQHEMRQREQQLKRQHEMRRQNEQQLKRQERELKRNEQQLKRQNEMQRRNEQQIRRQEQIKRDNRTYRIERKNERKDPRRYKKYDD